MNNKDLILSKLIKNQRQMNLERKLTFSDLKRVSSNLKDDICEDNCSIWNGYITNLNNDNKNCYISFFYKNKKVALHRLLYINFVGELNDNEYLKFTCDNKGKCCTLNHLIKVQSDSEKKIQKISIKEETKIDNSLEINNKNKVTF
jgi:hypothetical protein